MAGKTDRRAKAVSGMLTISSESEKWWKKPLNRQRNGRHATLVISGNDNDDMQLTNCCCQSLTEHMHVSHGLPFTPRRRQFPVCLLYGMKTNKAVTHTWLSTMSISICPDLSSVMDRSTWVCLVPEVLEVLTDQLWTGAEWLPYLSIYLLLYFHASFLKWSDNGAG